MKIIIEDKLLEIGITPNLKGFRFICEAIEMILNEPDIKICLMYELIARKYNSKLFIVERNIRHCVQKASGENKETNSEFLYRMALLIKREVEDEQ